MTLSGTVLRREDKRRAEDLAEQVSGVTHVQNNLRVKPRSEIPTTGDVVL
ncbi:MAG: BON domain-containing protein [Caulobacteraceae bacterium]